MTRENSVPCAKARALSRTMRSSSVSSPSRPSGSCQSNSLESFAGPLGRLLSLPAVVWAAVDMWLLPRGPRIGTVWLQYSPFWKGDRIDFCLADRWRLLDTGLDTGPG